jgi:hypothetical protein
MQIKLILGRHTASGWVTFTVEFYASDQVGKAGTHPFSVYSRKVMMYQHGLQVISLYCGLEGSSLCSQKPSVCFFPEPVRIFTVYFSVYCVQCILRFSSHIYALVSQVISFEVCQVQCCI